jgi:predicted peroxiredoxin
MAQFTFVFHTMIKVIRISGVRIYKCAAAIFFMNVNTNQIHHNSQIIKYDHMTLEISHVVIIT